jgi:protein SCO1/2
MRSWVCALALALCAAAPAMAEDGSGLPELGQVPDFALTGHDGKPVTRASLEGAAWIADFIFTRCAGQCPMMSQRMRQLQQTLNKADVRLVSFTVDPTHDTPEALTAYARQFEAVPGRWKFVTGDRDAIWALARDGFRVGVADEAGTPEEPIAHSIRFILVDRRGVIRGYYDATDEAAMTRLVRDVKRLEQP